MDGTAMAWTGGGTGGSAARRNAEFARARRHSRLVRILKFGLPLLAALIVAGGVAATWLARSLPGDLSFGSTSIEDGRLVMQDPRMSGVDANERPYSMIARRAMQPLGGGAIDLEGVRANLTVDSETTAELVAARGRYDQDAGILRLYDSISVETSSGITLRMSSADVAIADGRLVGSGPVSVTAPNQILQSGTLAIEDGGNIISFGNRVKLTLLPSAEEEAGRSVTSSD